MKLTTLYLVYRSGVSLTWSFDTDHPQRKKIEGQIREFLKSGKHCWLNTPSCQLRMERTYSNGKKWSQIVEISFEDLIYVSINDVDHDNFNDAGGKCPEGVDYSCLVIFDIPVFNGGARYIRDRFVGAWSKRNGGDFTRFVAGWRAYLRDPSQPTQLEWRIGSECYASDTLIMIPDFSVIRALEADAEGVIGNPVFDPTDGERERN